jgi:pimeloyl-ACP methyl ester carboxylesterase
MPLPRLESNVLTQEVRFARVPSGTRIAWAKTGSGPPLVRAAHWMTHVEHDVRSPIWKPWLERIGRRLTLVRYDARGSGLSGKDDRAGGADSDLEDLEAVVGASGLDRCALLGISAGTATAIAYAAAHPERVSHLVLLGGYAHGLLDRVRDAEKYLEGLLQLIETGWGRRYAPVQQFFTTTMLPDATSEQVAALNEQQRLSCDGVRAAAHLRSAAAADVRALLPRVRAPTLVLHCEGDAMVSIELGRELAASIEGAVFETLPGRNHVPLAGEPAFERFCDAVADFIAPAPGASVPDMTERERALLEAVAQGLDNAQIAAHLGIAEKTVRNALSRLYARLSVEGRPQAIVRARELGFGRG